MIADDLSQLERYASLHPRLARAIAFIRTTDLRSLATGRHPVEGDTIYVSMDRKDGRGRDGARLEAHRQYIDLQVTLAGAEEIGWSPLSSCLRPAGAYDEGRDILFFDDRPRNWSAVPPGAFAIFFPADAHAPLGGEGPIEKAIVKIRV